MVILNASYRKPLKFNPDVITQAERAWERLRGALRPATPQTEVPEDVVIDLTTQVEKTRAGFETAMDDDFNTSEALSHLFELVRGINQARDAGVESETLGEAQQTLRELSEVLGLELELEWGIDREAEAFIELLIEVREELRQAQQWALADLIRDRLLTLGVHLEDGKEGTTWRAG
jgi:cysteinyl-tRNA synthetase